MGEGRRGEDEEERERGGGEKRGRGWDAWQTCTVWYEGDSFSRVYWSCCLCSPYATPSHMVVYV